jgi:hypothetical protein
MDSKLDADRAKAWLDDPTLDRIIAAVGETLAIPDRDMLRQDLLLCYGRYSPASDLGQSGFVQRQSDRLNSIRKHASRLVELLKADDADHGIVRMVWPIIPEHPAHLLPQMIFLVETIDAMTGMQGKPGDLAERTKVKLGMSGSPLQWLTGTLLPAVYWKHFRKEAKISRSPDGTLGGPYIRFVRRVLAEAKIGCSDETIASALRRLKEIEIDGAALLALSRGSGC